MLKIVKMIRKVRDKERTNLRRQARTGKRYVLVLGNMNCLMANTKKEVFAMRM